MERYTFRFTFGAEPLSFEVTVSARSQVDAMESVITATQEKLARLGNNMTGMDRMSVTWVDQKSDEIAAASLPLVLVE